MKHEEEGAASGYLRDETADPRFEDLFADSLACPEVIVLCQAISRCELWADVITSRWLGT